MPNVTKPILAEGAGKIYPPPKPSPDGGVHHKKSGHAEPLPAPGETSASRGRTVPVDGLDGLDGLDGFIGGDGRIGAERFTAPDGANWWRGEEAGLLGKVFCYLADYVVLPETSLLVVSSWVLASYLSDLWDRFPHLAITSPEGRCGKTRLLELLEVICRAPWMLTSPTAAVVYRKIATACPTLLYDEAQALNRRDSENSTLIYELFCAGIGKNTCVPRCSGPDHQPVDFPIYCPKVLALVGRLRGILADRCLNVPMKRKRKCERTRRSRERVWRGDGAAIAAGLRRWAKTKGVRRRIGKAYDELDLFDIDNDRVAELLLPLQAVLTAEFGDDSHPLHVLREYVEGIEEMDREAERLSPGVRLLMACREVFASQEFLDTEYLLRRLHERTEEPWADYKNGKPLNAEGLATLLREYGIKPKRNGRQTARGYYSADFRDAWSRYAGGAPPSLLNPSSPSNPSNPSTPKKGAGHR